MAEKYNFKYMKHPKFKTKQTKLEMTVIKKKSRAMAEAEHEDDMFAFHDLTSLESQMQSLKSKGFLRAYRAYSPPADLLPRFLSCVSAALNRQVEQAGLGSVSLENKQTKLAVLSALSVEFRHTVHSSRLHLMTDLGRVLTFYQSPISSFTPYQQLHEDSRAGRLPSNLVVQLDPVRWSGKGDHPLDRVDAYPRRDTVVNSIKTRHKYRGLKKEHSAWQEDDYI